MSLSALAAATCPNRNGSSTMGVKKSVVCTIARSGVRRYTPASSLVSYPTNTFGSTCFGRERSTESRILGLSLAAQPAALAMVVSFTVSAKLPPSEYGRRIIAREETRSPKLAQKRGRSTLVGCAERNRDGLGRL